MSGDFHAHHDWHTLLQAFSVWFVHFMAVWIISIALPGASTGRWLALPLSLAALAALGWLWRKRKDAAIASVASLSVLIAAAAILFSTLPALIG